MLIYIATVALLLMAFVGVHGTRYLKSQSKIRRIQASRQKRQEMERALSSISKDATETRQQSDTDRINA